jgi:palmitoyltransferase
MASDDGILWKIVGHVKWLFEGLIRLLGPLFVVLATFLISMVIIVYFRAILPYYIEDWFSLEGIFHLTLSAWIAFNLWFNYYKTIFTTPGYTPEVVSVVFQVSRHCAKLSCWKI